jgi:hypothetical protein
MGHDRLLLGPKRNHSVTQSLSHSVTQSLSHSVTRSLSHSVTQSLSHSFLFFAWPYAGKKQCRGRVYRVYRVYRVCRDGLRDLRGRQGRQGRHSDPGGHGAATSSGTPTSTAASAASQAASTDPGNPANPADPVRVSLTRSAVIGAAEGALSSTALAGVQIVADEHERRVEEKLPHLTWEGMGPLLREKMLRKQTAVDIAGGMVAGVAGALTAATNTNAYNRAIHDKRGNETKSWLRRTAEPVAAAYVGSVLGKYVAKRTLGSAASFGTRRYV